MGTYLGKNPIGAVVPITYKYLEQVTKEDTSSIDVSDALPFPIRNLQIQGNSIQDGTPTLEAPIEIQSVGERTINLADISKGFITQYTGITNEVIGNTIKTTCSVAARGGNLTIGTFPAGVYTIKVKKFSSFVDGVETPKALTTFVNNKNVNIGVNASQKVKITLTETSTITFYHAFNNTNDYYILEDLILYEGEEEKEFEPYGYKIPIKIINKNLFNPSKWASGTLTMFNDIPCLHIKDTGQTYSYALDGDSSDVYRLTIKYYRASDSEDKVSNLYSKIRGALITNTKHNTLYTTIVYGGEAIYFTGWGKDMYIDLTITQLEKGKMGVDFEPYGKSINIYLKEPLRRINDVVDVLDYKNKKVTRNIGSIIYNATESWSKYDSGNGYMESNKIFIDGKPVICNMLINSDKLVKTLAMRKNYANIYAYGTQDYYPTQAEWHAFLAENNMEVIGQLVTPTEEPIDIETITLEEGCDKIVVDTTTEPSNFKIVYLIDADI